MVIILATISQREAERLGMEFCDPFKDEAGTYEIKRVSRTWVPKNLQSLACVFLYPFDYGFECTAREERPEICSAFNCVDSEWAAKMDYKVLSDKYYIEENGLDSEERKRRLAKVEEARNEVERIAPGWIVSK